MFCDCKYGLPLSDPHDAGLSFMKKSPIWRRFPLARISDLSTPPSAIVFCPNSSQCRTPLLFHRFRELRWFARVVQFINALRQTTIRW